jgi:hypothetical protein
MLKFIQDKANKIISMAKKNKTVSNTSPKGGRRGCLCEDGTYKAECCEGTLQAQGVGSLVNQVTSNVVNTNTVRQIN